MSLVGNLEDLGLGEILQIVSLSRKSGILSLQTDGREGKVYFHDGQVIRANTSSRRENLGELLLRKELVDFDTLKEAVQVQQSEGEDRRLGDILADRFDISRDAIEAAVKEQVEKIVYSFFTWSEGTFSFTLGDAEELGETSFSPLQFMLDQGLNPQWLAMEGSRLLDEKIHRGESLEEEQEEGPAFDIDALLSGEVDLSAAPCEPNDETTPLPDSVGDIYLIDDDAEMLSAVSAGLESTGLQVVAFDDAEEFLYGVAAAVDAGEKPRLLVDLIMPRKDGQGILGGLELLEQVYSRFPDLPTAVMSEQVSPEAEEKLRDLGEVPLIEKPKKGRLTEDGGDAVAELVASAGRALDLVPQGEPPAENTADVDEKGGATFNLGAELRREFGEQDNDSARGVASPGLHLLRDMLVELQNPSLGGGIILLALRFASELMNRAVIFAVKDTEIIGLGQFGIKAEGENADARIRRMRLSTKDESVFKSLIEAMTPMNIPLGTGPVDTYIAEELGGGRPKEVFLGPILSEGKVVAILYGDNLPAQEEIGDTESLEIFLSQAGLAMEKAILERRLRINRDE
ncbi:MAG: DUF4388 domain-containing protein [Desulfuromonadales bacterium]|nr:DUF4388 domain-containing protein [Desulfuromonadales bacterium]NIR33983.1 DUF4388 domain-containing protein [Desulfuromonadales bacterium]NIS42655.1 DUF4388 domain-containing protein [Desulfuromonadales bacterium]